MGTGGQHRVRTPAWSAWPTERLLGVRICDLGLTIEGTPIEASIGTLRQELKRAGLRYMPPVWLGEEWYTPPELPGISVPFYLAHPRLIKLERRLMFDVEGGSRETCMKLLRHEAGHALQFAYRLHRRREWQRIFGSSSVPYPDAYKPRAYSRDYVLHLDNYYAQAHPDEDFAETFAVWLRPGSRWRTRYADWPALRKLEYVDRLMREIGGKPPAVRSRRADQRLSSIRQTLGEHYDARRRRYGLDSADVYDRDLRRLFEATVPGDTRDRASSWLRKSRRGLIAVVGEWTEQFPYTVNDIINVMIARASEMKLRVPDDRTAADLEREVAVMLAVQTMSHLQRGGRWVTL
ncbi:MAG: putative zinc-binding metallopeptidase [Planctomycetota bacterium]